MRIAYVTPRQTPRLSGFGAFGESAESHCARVYADCPALMTKCLKCIGVTNPFTGECLGVKPYTDVGKKLRGLPADYQPGQCPGAPPPPATVPPPQQQPYNPPPPQQPYNPPPQQQAQPGGGVVVLPGGGGAPVTGGAPAASFTDQLLANKPLLVGGAAALAFVAWKMSQGQGGGRSRRTSRR